MVFHQSGRHVFYDQHSHALDHIFPPTYIFESLFNPLNAAVL